MRWYCRRHDAAKALIAALLVAGGTAMMTSRDKHELLFGLRLPAPAEALRAEVEADYGRPVREEWLERSDARMGNSKVDADGTPVIYLHPKFADRLDIVVHELYHFRLRTDGYPAIQWLFPPHMDTPSNQNALRQIMATVFDPILHFIFYPAVRAWGVDPGATFEENIRSALASGELVRGIAAMDDDAVALFYFRVSLELGDQQLLQAVLQAVTAATRSSAVSMGRDMVREVESSRPDSPNSATNVLVRCLNRLYSGRFRFTEREWGGRTLGMHQQAAVSILVEPLR